MRISNYDLIRLNVALARGSRAFKHWNWVGILAAAPLLLTAALWVSVPLVGQAQGTPPVQPTGLTATPGDAQAGLAWDDPTDSSITGYEYLLDSETGKLTASDGAIDDWFGSSVSVDGDTLVVGARGNDDDDDVDPGAAYVFTRQMGMWSPVAKLTASDAAPEDWFGFSVGVDGDTVVVGAPWNDANGSAYLFAKPETGWATTNNQTAKLTASDGAEGDRFGRSVGVAGDTVVVGAYRDDANGSDSGSAYLFTKPETGWATTNNQTAKLTASDGAEGDRFGYSIGVDGDTVVVGAYEDDDNGLRSGSAYLFTKPETGWVTTNNQTAKLTASDGAEGDRFGRSVGVAGDTVVVGANRDDDNGSGSGSAYLFTKPADGWVTTNNQMAKLTASDGAIDDWFGSSVSVDGDTVVVGAYLDDDNGIDSGSAYVFTKPGTGWTTTNNPTAKLTASDGAAKDEFGISVGVAGDTVVVGAHQDDDNGIDSGSAYVYEVSDWTTVPDSAAGATNATSYTVTGLTNGSDYAFRIRATNSAGTGPASDAVTVFLGPPVQPTGLTATPGDAQAGLAWDDPTDSSITGYEYLLDSETGKLTASDGAIDDWFGSSVSVDGDTLVVGARGNDDDDDVDPGAAYVFTRQMGMWSPVAKLTASDAAPEDWFGFSVGVDGDTVVVGAPWNDANGSAYLFAKPETGWATTNNQTAKLTASDGAEGDRFGRSVGVAGDTVVVGAYRDDANGSDSGSAYLFTKPETGWATTNNQTAKLTASDGAEGDRFGYSIGVDGDTVVVGAYEDDDNGLRSGSAYLFTKPETGWVTTNNQTAKLTASDGAEGDRFGRSVGVAGDTVVVGANRDDDNGSGSGSAYLFTKPADGWVTTNNQMAKLTASDGAIDDWFGSSVSVDGDTVVVGAYLDDDNGIDSGSAYVFTKPGTGWTTTNNPTAKLTASDGAAKDEFGISVGVAGDTVVVGAHQDDDNGIDSGSTYVYEVSRYAYYGVSGWTTVPDSAAGATNATSYTVTGLTNGLDYALRIRAVNAFAKGAASEIATATPANAVPTAVDDTATTAEDTAVDINVTANDTDPDAGATLSVTGVTTPTEGTAVIVSGSTTTVTYTPDAHYYGTDSFDYTLSDGTDTDTGTVTVTVTKVSGHHTAPAAPLDLSATPGNGRITLSWADPDDDTITKYQYSSDSGTNFADISGSGATTTTYTVTVLSDGTNAALANGIEYTLSVRAVSGSELGAASTVTVVMVPAKPTGLTGTPHNSQVELGWDDPDNSNVTKYQLLHLEPSKLTSDAPREDDFFGMAVAVDGDTALVGALQAYDADFNLRPGAVYVFTRSEGVWSQQAKLTASDASNGDGFGRSVALDNGSAVVGAYQDAEGESGEGQVTGTGAAYVFTKPAGGWATSTETAKLTADDAERDDQFGYSVAVDGDTIVVGAHFDDDGGDESGSAYVFTKPLDGSWASTNTSVKLTAPDAAADGYFGNSVAIEGETIVIGAHKADSTDNQGTTIVDSGSVYLFTASSEGWADTVNISAAKLTASDAAAEDEFGTSVAIDSDTIVVGASKHDQSDTVADSGAAYVFTRPGNAWATSTETAKLTASDGLGGDEFGNSVAVFGDTVVIGAHKDEDKGIDSGAAYVFTKPSSGWATASETAKIIDHDGAASDQFGWSIAVDSSNVLVGAHRDDVGDRTDSGSAYILGIPDWNDIAGSGARTKAHTVTGLANGHLYTFQLRALNSSGHSPASDRLDVTPKAVPYAPANLTATPQNGQVALSWDDPTDASIASYQYSTDGGTIFTDIGGSGATTTTYTVTGLTNGARHTMAVRAVNGLGNGAVSSVTVLMVPAAPNLSAAAGDAEVALSWDDPSNDTITKYQLWQHTEIAKLVEDGGSGENDEFGNAVAVDGSTAVIGVPNDASGNIRPGSAFVFTRDINGVWSPKAKLRAANRNAQDRFGISVAVDGDTIVVGASGDTHNDGQTNSIANAGSAYVFTMPAGGWTDTDTPTGELAASDPASNDQFGNSVAVDQSTGTIVVGAWNDDSNKGSVYVFTSDDNVNWSQAAKLTDPNGAQNHYFGGSVAVDGDSVLIGASGDDSNKGAAFVFADPGNGWKDTIAPPVKLTASDGEPNDLFGASASMDGNTAVIGAIGYDSTDSEGNQVINSGSAYVFVKPDGGWDADQYDGNETALLTAIAADYDGRGNNFGGSVVVDGGTVVVGADGVDQSSIVANTGAAYVFTKPATGWADSNNGAKFTASDSDTNNKFGGAVAVSGNTVLVGADGVDQIAAVTGSGAAYVFDIQDWDDIPESKSTTSHTVTGLTNYQEYWFRVRAVNLSGPGRASETVSAIPRIGKPDKPTGLSAKAGDARVTLNWADPYNDTISGYQIAEVIEEDFLIASVGAASAHFGISVAIDGDTAVVGADRANNRKGSVYIFTRDSSGDWTQQVKLEGEDTGDQFGWSVAVDRDTVVVGAHAYDVSDGTDTLPNSGAVYVFTKPDTDANSDGSTDWEDWGSLTDAGRAGLTAKLTAAVPEAYAFFGGSVALDGNTLAIGSRLYDAGGRLGAGAAYVFTKTNDVWSQAAKLTASTSLQLAYLGYSLAVDGDTVLVGAYGDDTVRGELGSGSAYVFEKPSGGWDDWDALEQTDKDGLTAKLTASDRQPSGYFGFSVALDGNTAVIGARQHSDPETGAGSGAAYVFTRAAGVWGEKAKLTASDAAAGDNFGVSVAVEGDTVVIGSWQDDDNGRNSGSAYVFEKPALGWAPTFETLKLTAPDGAANDRFGWSVAVDLDDVRGDLALVGAYSDDNAAALDAGSVHVLGIPDWEEIDPSEADTTAHTVTKVPDGTGNGPALTNGNEYNFQIRALNRSGASPASDGVKATPLAKPTMVTELMAAPADAQVRLSWDPPGDDDDIAPITGYQIQYREKVADGEVVDWDDDSWDDIPGSGATTTGYTVTQLANNTEYEFRVRPVNDIGEGGPAKTEAEPIDNPPAKPTGLAAVGGDSQVTLTWDDPYDLSIDKYQYTTDSGSNFTDIPDSGAGEANATSYLVRNLTNGTMYTFRIRAVDVHDDPSPDQNSVVSEPDSARPSSSTPLAPTELTATTGDMKVRLTWDDPGDSSIDEYKYSTDNFATVKTLALTANESIDAGTIEYTVIKQSKTTEDSDELPLQNGTMYTFKVWAVDNEAVSPEGPAAEVTATPLPGQPREPENLAARKGDSLVRLTWQHPDTTGAPITKYEFVHLLQTNPLHGEGDDKFGYAVAVDGDTAVIGEYQDDREDDAMTPDVDESAVDSGAAYVFTRVEGVWEERVKLTASDGEAYDNFGISVAVSGGIVVIGASGDDGAAANSGSVYVFVKPASNGGWADWKDLADDAKDALTAKLTASDAAAMDYFGHSVAVSVDTDSETVLVGAYQDNDGGETEDSGSAYIFMKPVGNEGWTDATETAKLTPDDAADDDYFGTSVALDGDTAVIGAHGDDDNGIDSGSAYVFVKSGAAWTTSTGINEINQTAKLNASKGAAGDGFGVSVAVDADTVVIGAPGDDREDDPTTDVVEETVVDAGSAYVFVKPSVGGWASGSEPSQLTADDGEAGDYFGYSVAVDIDTVVAGAYGDDDNGDESGSAYVFTRDSQGEWSQTNKLTAEAGEAGDWFGYSVAVDSPGHTALVGAGSAHLLDTHDWEEVPGGKDARTHIVDGLSNGRMYDFKVRGVNSFHQGPPAVGSATPGTGGSSLSANNNPEFNEGDNITRAVSENAPVRTPVGGPVTATGADDDTLEYSLFGEDRASFNLDRWTGQLTTKTSFDFEAQNEYSVRVEARDGEGGFEIINLTITVGDVDEPPSPPGAPQVIVAGPTGLTVGWTEPHNQGPAITGYDVQYREVGGQFRDAGYNGLGTSATLEGLIPATSYEVQVRAVNDEGVSPWSDSGRGETGQVEEGPVPTEPTQPNIGSTPTPVPTLAPLTGPTPTVPPTGAGGPTPTAGPPTATDQGPEFTPESTGAVVPTPMFDPVVKPIPVPQAAPIPESVPTVTPLPVSQAPEPTPEPTPAAEPALSEADTGDEGFPWWIIAVILIGIAAGILLIIWVRRRRNRTK